MGLTVIVTAKPQGESTVVGGFIIEMNGSYPEEEGPILRRQQVRISCQYLNKKGKTKETFFMATSDSLGYFKIENVPAGRYMLKAIECTFGRGGRITLASKFGHSPFGDQQRYWGMMNGMIMDNVGDLLSDQFEGSMQNGIIDLGITFIEIKAVLNPGESSIGRLSPDGKPPWQRISYRDRGQSVDLHMMSWTHFDSFEGAALGTQNRNYTRESPVEYFASE